VTNLNCNLPVITKHDRRFVNAGEHEAVETEALSQGVIAGIVRERLDALLKGRSRHPGGGKERERELIEIRTKESAGNRFARSDAKNRGTRKSKNE